MKTCASCAVSKQIDDYYKTSRGGLFAKCKTCCAEAQRKRIAASPEKRKAVVRQSYAKHREARLAAGKEYRRNRPDAERARHKAYRANNPEKAREQQRRYREANRDAINRKALAQYHANPAQSAAAARRRKYGVTTAQLDALRMAQDFKCPVCQRLLNDVSEHVDHCHETGVVRGILCAECNKAEGILRKAAGGGGALADALARMSVYLALDIV